MAFTGDERRRDAFALTGAARRAGLRAQLELAGRSLKGQLKQADRLGARYVAIVGQEGTVLRDMESGDQHVMGGDIDAVVAAVLRGRGPASL